MASSFSRLPPLPALRDFIHMYNLKARRILSQNFLMDMNITRKIVRKANIEDGDYVVEIGPGPGGITRAILETGCERLDVVEIDHRFLPALRLLAEASDDRLFIHHADILKTDLGSIWSRTNAEKRNWFDPLPNMHIVGNLPFNIASPLIIKFLREMHHRLGPWSYGRVPLTLTFQLEVARRLIAPIDCDERARISVMSIFVSEPKLLFEIPGTCFVPKPKVDVGVVRFVPRSEPLIHCAFELIEKVCRNVFHYRQKYVIKSLKTLYPNDLAKELAHEILSKCRIDPTIQSFKLGVEQFADICHIYEEQCERIPGLFLYDYTRPKQTLESLSHLPLALPPKYLSYKSIPSEGVSLSDSDSIFNN